MMMDELMNIFIEETREHLELLNESLLELEKDPFNPEVINQIFRVAHTIKGSSATVGFTKMQHLTHGMEDVFHDIRDGKIIVNQKIIDLLFVCSDMLENSLDEIVRTGLEADLEIDNILNTLHSTVTNKSEKLHSQVHAVRNTPSSSPQTVFNANDWKTCEDCLAQGLLSYKISIVIEDDSAFKSTIAYMVFQAMEDRVQIVKSNPLRPSEEEYRSGVFQFEETQMIFYGYSDIPPEKLSAEISAALPWVKNVDIEPADFAPATPVRLADTPIVDGEESDSSIPVHSIFAAEVSKEILSLVSRYKTAVHQYKTTDQQPGKEDSYSVYRVFHSIKGLANFINHNSISTIAHLTERVIERFENGAIPFSQDIMTLINVTADLTEKFYKQPEPANDTVLDQSIGHHAERLESFLGSYPEHHNEIGLGKAYSPKKDDDIIPGTPVSPDANVQKDTLQEIHELIEHIDLHSLTLETEPEAEDAIYNLYRDFHSIKGLAEFIGQTDIAAVAAETEQLMEGCWKGRTCVNRNTIDVIIESSELIKQVSANTDSAIKPEFVKRLSDHHQKVAEAQKALLIPISDSGHTAIGAPPTAKIGEILVELGAITPDDVQDILDKQKQGQGSKFGEIAVAEKKIPAGQVIHALRSQEDVKPPIKAALPADGGYLRIQTNKIDNLVDLLGELLIGHSLLEQEIKEHFHSNDKIVANLSRTAKLIKNIQNLSLSLRMVSLKQTFQKLVRISRDTAVDLGKNVEVVVSGEDTEIDRSVAEKLLDPLMHLVRNAVSHGIEPESDRVAKGKPASGQILLKAYSKRGNVYIEVADDGKGLSVEQIRQKAIEKKLINPNGNYSSEEIIKLIFLPGFSTRETVDAVSGRGVGMNVVETEITKIGGKIQIDNNPGRGCTFMLKIPINLAIMNGTIVEIRQNKYILPTLNIKKIMKPQAEQWISIKGKQTMIRDRDEMIPLIPIHDIFGLEPPEIPADILLVLELDRQMKALPVNAVLGRQEIVVKPLGNEFRYLNFASGASILGDGRVSLILDLEALFQSEKTNS